MIRLFVGLELPSELAERVAALGFGLPGARWVSARNLHLTLCFVGEVDEGVAEDIHHALADLSLPAFAMNPEGFGMFGDRHRAHTLWLGVERSEALDRLAAKAVSAVTLAGVRPDGRKFNPHITLARLKDSRPDRIQAFVAANAGFTAPPVAVDHVALFRSTLTRQGAEYDVLERYPLTRL